MSAPRVRVEALQAKGQMLLDGHKIEFEMTIEGSKLSASFNDLPTGLFLWDAYKALELFVDLHLRG